MKFLLAAATVIAGLGLAATTHAAYGTGRQTDRPRISGDTPDVAYSRGVTGVCAGALLFDHPHAMGTRADALSVARDIRASTARRLARVAALPTPTELEPLSRRWIASQRRLAALYAQLWVRIFDTIAAAETPAQHASLPRRLEKLVHAPDRLKSAAERLELKLHVPDCTGGG